MYKYTKIEIPFNRDMDGTKKLIEGSFRNPAVEYLANNRIMVKVKVKDFTEG